MKLTLLKFRLECVLTGTSRRIVKYKLDSSACLALFTLVRRFETGAGAPPRPISSGEALREQLRDGGGRAVEKKRVLQNFAKCCLCGI